MVSGWAAPLARYPAGTRASYLAAPHPQSVLLDLALQAAGLIAVPLSGGPREPEPRPRVEIEGESLVLPSLEEAGVSAAALPDPERLGSGGAVLGDIGETLLSQGDLLAAAERLGRAIPTEERERRDVVVLARTPESPAERDLLSWVTLTGAAVLFEPDPALLVPTAVWARVTVFAGTVADLVQLRTAAEEDESGFRVFGRRRRRPFGRLRAVLSTDGEMAVEGEAFWKERRVVTGTVDGFAAERQERGI